MRNEERSSILKNSSSPRFSIVDVVYEWSLPNAKLLQVAVEIPTVLKSISSRDQVNVLITSEGFLLPIPDLTWALKTFFQESTSFFRKRYRYITYAKGWIKRFKIRISLDLKRCVQKYSRLRCLLRVKGLVICFYLGWSGSILQFSQNIIKVGSKSWLLTCRSNITLSLPSYTVSAF